MNASDHWIGQPLDRVDGIAKVTGAARYAAEAAPADVLYAALVTSEIARGRIATINVAEVQALPGVVRVLCHETVPRLPEQGAPTPPAQRVLSLLQTDEVHYNNEPIAVVIARSLEEARDAARQVQVGYRQSPARLGFADAKTDSYPPKTIQGEKPDSARGDVNAAYAGAAAQLTETYTTPLEFHNPMEPHATLAVWQAEKLTLYDSTQYVSGVRASVAKALGIAKENIRVVCPYTGGGFGSKGSTWSHVVLTALAAKLVGRPVKLVLDRTQMFGAVGHRPRTEQTVQLAANERGELQAIRHQVVSSTSVLEDWTESSAIVTRSLYACPNVETSHRLAKLNIGTPTFMRAPGEATGTFALESALDELSYRLKIDPIDLRLANYAEADPDSGKAFTSKQLRECYRIGAEQFGWARRSAAPRSMQDGDEWVGMGMATAVYPARRSKANAVARLNADGSVFVASGTQELGTGLYTIMTQVAADTLGFPLHSVHFHCGDTDYPEAPVSGGSQSTASVAPAVEAACLKLRAAVIAAAIADRHSPLFGLPATGIAIRDGWLVDLSSDKRRDAAVSVVARGGGQPIEAQAATEPGPEKKELSAFSFGAVFAEVRVDPALGVVRVERICGVYDIGRFLNAKTGRSQLIGGIVWGIGLALQEVGELDERSGRIVNNSLGEYHVPVNADVRTIQVTALDAPDMRFNPLGARGIGEIGITGVGAALANAVYHATGRRIRDLPITLDKLI